ncbi:hypothetical protein R0137_16385 [Congregibacter brevis]|uniref:IPTL-CTERM protein sorting domain-containing protein n=1 Tax=Congregibacter brevis TaxID=3081201 RepID=A0ABZ0IBC3_9GAMM|nr:hypothetical protein R0137_16385 [Congregibacter sp. IMCC45268]
MKSSKAIATPLRLTFFWLLTSCGSTFAQTTVPINVKDNISSSVGSDVTGSFNQQILPGRQIIMTPITLNQPTSITRVVQRSNQTLTSTSAFAYFIHEPSPPYAFLESGPATLDTRASTSDITLTGANTNRDEFSLATSVLPPGDYFFGVAGNDSQSYQLIGSTVGPGREPLLAESGGAPFIAGTDIRLFMNIFGAQTPTDVKTVPVMAWPLLLLMSFALTIIARRHVKAARGRAA